MMASETKFLINSNGNSYFNGGNVGIGTTSPNATLQVGNSDNTGAPVTEVEVKRLSLAPVTHSGSDWFFTTRDNGPYANLDIGYSSNKTLTIRHDGNVGIGTTNPDSKLAVKGRIHAEEVKVDLTVPGPDYVFEEDYNLRTLEDLQQFLIKKRHLPDIPSAKEMEENGIDVGVMNMKLLQKIEELTLYLIQQNHTIKAQTKKMETQMQQIETLVEMTESMQNEIRQLKKNH